MKKLILAPVFLASLLLLTLVSDDAGWLEAESLDSPGEVTADNFSTANVTLEGFKSRAEVKDYVISTGLTRIRLKQMLGTLSGDEAIYEDWDCDDYAIALAEQARHDGRKIGLALTMEMDNRKLAKVHMTNYAIIGNRIEDVSPQTGAVKELWYGYRVKVD